MWRNGLLLHPQEILVNDTNHTEVSDEAMAVNGIDLESHTRLAVMPNVACDEFKSYISNNLLTRARITLGGHNTQFDVGFITGLLGDFMEERFQRRTVDTSGILKFLYHAGIIPSDLGSLENALKYFKLSTEGSHNALVDARNTAKLYNQLLRRVVTSVRGS